MWVSEELPLLWSAPTLKITLQLGVVLVEVAANHLALQYQSAVAQSDLYARK